MAVVGQQLTAPESGWRRYDEKDSRLLYMGSGTWISATHASRYSGSIKYSSVNTITPTTHFIEFKFKGTKLRLIDEIANNRPLTSTVVIDETVYSYTAYNANYLSSSPLFQGLVFEVSNLADTVHTVKIYSNMTGYLCLDAIDVDSTGYLLHPTLTQKTKLEELEIGDCVPCRYTATSGVAGTFSELGTCIADEIPITGSATPNGLFYFIKNDKGMLIADRIIQHSISWDVLNAGRYIEGRALDFNENPVSMTSNTAPQPFVVSASQEGTLTPAFHAFTGSESQYWHTSEVRPVGGHWIKVDCGINNTMYVSSIRMQQMTSSGAYGIKDFEVFGSNDDVTYTKLGEGTAPQNFNHNSFEMSVKGDFRYVRINFLNTYDGSSRAFIRSVKILSDKRVLLRSLSGGVAHADAGGNLSLTDKSLGAFPTTNEWDKYIVKSDLGGKVVAGDYSIWNHYSVYSLCKDTPTVSIVANTSRVRRVGNADNVYRWFHILSNSPQVSIGFRPVVDYIEPGSKAINLFY